MSVFLLYHRRSRPTGSVIAEALGVPHGETFRYGEGEHGLIRWGSRVTRPSWVARLHPRVVNTAGAITLASDKLATLEALEAAGVSVPRFSDNPENLEYPFIGRRTHHARGTDIVLCLQRGDYLRQPRDYYVQYIPTTREFRVHVVGGRVVRVQGKYLDRSELAVPWVRNYANGYRFRAPRRRVHSHRLETAVNAVRALGLDFGAVDLLLGDDGRTYVLEVNTAPACSPLTAAAYVTAFQQLLEIPSEQVNLARLDMLSPDQDDGDTEDEVEGEEPEETMSAEEYEDLVTFVSGTGEQDRFIGSPSDPELHYG